MGTRAERKLEFVDGAAPAADVRRVAVPAPSWAGREVHYARVWVGRYRPAGVTCQPIGWLHSRHLEGVLRLRGEGVTAGSFATAPGASPCKVRRPGDFFT
jgi:hypothetical protein